MALHVQIARGSFRALCVGLVVLALLSTGSALYDPSEGQVPGFTQYPPAEDCGLQLPVPLQGDPACPVNTCVKERRACNTANRNRWRCTFGNLACTFLQTLSYYKTAVTACNEATSCVQNACHDNSSCRVRSFYSGECCLPA